MTRDDIIKLALEAGFEEYEWSSLSGNSELDQTLQVGEYPVGEAVFKFATLIQEATLEKNNLTWVANCQHLVNAEREACAQVCEAWGPWIGDGQLVANAIRARGQRSG